MTGEAGAPRRRQRSSGWIATLLGGGVLVALGFGFGLVVGASVEDPDLIASVMAGQAEEFELPPEETIADRFGAAPEPVAPRPLGAPRDEPAPVAAAPPGHDETRRAAAPPPLPKAAPRSGFSVQVGAFREETPAQGLRSQLEASGFKAYVDHSDEGSDQRWRVRVGPVDRRDEADGLAQRLKRDQGLPTWVVSEE